MNSLVRKIEGAVLRRANEEDIFKISQLYYEIYQGSYPDPMVNDLKRLKEFIKDPNHFWVIAMRDEGVVASVIFDYDPAHRLAKAFGAIVDPVERKSGLALELTKFGHELINDEAKFPIEVLYATTRTVHAVAQKLTEKLNFKKLGIFPNAHRTTDYETHCLASLITDQAIQKRFKDFKIHPKIAPLFKMAKEELNLPDLNLAELKKPLDFELNHQFNLEVINAPKFVKERFNIVHNEGRIDNNFFPFHYPNVLITSPDQTTEVFLYINESDRHCVIIGVSTDPTLHHQYFSLLRQITEMLRTLNVRYIETIVRADKTDQIDKMLKAKFIPCAYFPAFQLLQDKRFDFVVFSRSFEVFDFSNIELHGRYKEYLEFYFEMWKEISLKPKLITNNET